MESADPKCGPREGKRLGKGGIGRKNGWTVLRILCGRVLTVPAPEISSLEAA